jgi:hypothetical protein
MSEVMTRLREEHRNIAKVLTPEDWGEIDARITGEQDPLFGAEVAEDIAVLRDGILNWEREDEALEAPARPSDGPVA